MSKQVEMADIKLQAAQPQYYLNPPPLQSTPYNQQQPNPFNQQQHNPFNQQQPNPFNQPVPNDYGAFAACNQGLSNGFGAMFFNIRDPNFTQKN